MNCGEVRNQLAAYALGDLPEHAAGEVRQHLETCAECRADEQTLRGDLAVVQAALARRHAETPRLTPSRRAAILEARRRKFDPTRLPVRRILEWAAAAMILIMLAGMLMPGMSRARVSAYRVPKGSGSPMSPGTPMPSRDFAFTVEEPGKGGEAINGEKDESDGDGVEDTKELGAADINLTGAKPVVTKKKQAKRADVSYEAGAAAPFPSDAPGVRSPGRDRNGGAMGGWPSDGKQEEPAMFGGSVSLEADLEKRERESKLSSESTVVAGGGGGGRMGVGGSVTKLPEARIAGGCDADDGVIEETKKDATLAYSLSEARPNAPAAGAAAQPALQQGSMDKGVGFGFGMINPKSVPTAYQPKLKAISGRELESDPGQMSFGAPSAPPPAPRAQALTLKHDENGRNGKDGGDNFESVPLKGIYAGRAKGQQGPDIQVAVGPERLTSQAGENGTPPPPSDHDTVAMTTETRQRIGGGLAAKAGSASQSKPAFGGDGYSAADIRILEGKLNLAQKKLDEASRIRVGTVESQKVIEPGRSLSIQVKEPNKVSSEPPQPVTVVSGKKDPSAELAAQSAISFHIPDLAESDARPRFVEDELPAQQRESAPTQPAVVMKRLVSAAGENAAPEPIYPPQVFNPIIETKANPFSTFGIDVDTASFTVARRYLLGGRLPPPGAIRVEEFVNALEYAYKPPERAAFAVYCDRTRSPFRPSLEVLRIGVRGKVLGRDRQRALALTFVVDTSGSMNTPDRLELAQKSMNLLLDNLMEGDSMAIVAFGSEARLVLDRTKASRKDEIRAAIASLQTYGSTHLEGGIRLGYEIAARRYQTGLANRVMIFSDGVANLGAASSDEILQQVEAYRKQGIFCSVFGLGAGAYNDAMLQALADKGDGVYRYLDSVAEAKRVLVDEAAATLQVIAKDMKIQVEFSPERVKAYRQIGYEKRHLEKEQFRDDTVDAGEVGSGQSATALYEIETVGAASTPLGVVRLRWKDPDSGLVTETAQSIQGSDRPVAFEDAPPRFRLAVGAAELADWLRDNPLSAGTEGADIRRILQTVGSELSLDRQVQDVVRMAAEATRLKKGVNR